MPRANLRGHPLTSALALLGVLVALDILVLGMWGGLDVYTL